MNMAELLDQYGSTIRLRKGQILTGTVVGKNDAGWLVDVGFRCEGVLPEREYTCNAIIETQPEPKPGDAIEVEAVSVRDGEEAQLVLSRWRHELSKRWDELEAKINEDGQVMQVRGISRVKGGLTVEACGLEGFIPLSHLTLAGKGADPSIYVGQNITVKVLDHDRKKSRLVFSRRELLEEAEAERKAKFYERVHEGDIVEGEVSSLTDFGVFVNLGDRVDGLVHVTELTWKRNVKIRDMFKKGDKVTVKVIGIDKEKDRISLSIERPATDQKDELGDMKADTTHEIVSLDKIAGAREIMQAIHSEHYHNVILCPKGFQDTPDAQGIDADFVADASDTDRLHHHGKIALFVLSRRNLAQVVDILADKADELRIFCRTDTVDIAYGMN